MKRTKLEKREETNVPKRRSSNVLSEKRIREEGICALPQDMLGEVMSWLIFEEKRAYRLVNKLFCQVLDSRYLKQIICIRIPVRNFVDLDREISRWPKGVGIQLWDISSQALAKVPARITHLNSRSVPPTCWPDHVVELFTSDSIQRWDPPGNIRNLTSLSFVAHDADLSQAINLTSLTLTSHQKDFEMLLSLPRPEKIVRLNLNCHQSIVGMSRINLDRFADVMDLTLLCVDTSTRFRRLERLRLWHNSSRWSADSDRLKLR